MIGCLCCYFFTYGMNTYTSFEIFIVVVSSSVNNTGYVTPRKLNNISVCLISMHMKYFFLLYHINISSTNNIPILWVPFYKEEDRFVSLAFCLYVCVISLFLLKKMSQTWCEYFAIRCCATIILKFSAIDNEKWQLHEIQCVNDPNTT
jgi:hypothetical protein